MESNNGKGSSIAAAVAFVSATVAMLLLVRRSSDKSVTNTKEKKKIIQNGNENEKTVKVFEQDESSPPALATGAVLIPSNEVPKGLFPFALLLYIHIYIHLYQIPQFYQNTIQFILHLNTISYEQSMQVFTFYKSVNIHRCCYC